ncbi:hypothetical protein GCM10018987_17560 [Streptomyces cremeus]
MDIAILTRTQAVPSQAMWSPSHVIQADSAGVSDDLVRQDSCVRPDLARRGLTHLRW